MTKTLDSLLAIGLIEVPREIPILTDEPRISSFFCSPNNISQDKYDTEDSFGQGFDFNRNKSKIKSMAEALERLCLFNPNGNMIHSRFKDDETFARPSDFNCYSNEQIPELLNFLNELDESEYEWVTSKNLTTGRDVLIPAQTVFLYTNKINEKPIRKEQISTGAAFGKIGEQRALRSGFMETIERDGIMNFYLTRRQGRKMHDFSARIQELIDYFSRYQLETHIFDTTSNLGIPTIFALTVDRSGIGDAINVGSKSDLTYEGAIMGALMESIQCRRYSRTSFSFKPPAKIPDDQNIHSLEERFLYWGEIDRISDLNFMINEEPSISYNNLNRKRITFTQALNRVKSKGFNIYVVDISLPDIKSRGFETKKVIIPELHPLYLDERENHYIVNIMELFKMIKL